MSSFGLTNCFSIFLASYLSNRSQYVYHRGFKSYNFEATSGVPQGSNLGPLLFLIFINDLSQKLTCEHLLYADDLKIFSSVNNTEDCVLIQHNLDVLESWCSENNLNLNASKCKIMCFSRKQHPINFEYKISNAVLDMTELFKDLGVWFAPRLSFSSHIDMKAAEASKFYGFIVRNCKSFSNLNTLKLLYFSYVRSRLEYAALVWKPYYNNKKTAIENVQRRFLKYLHMKVTGSYPDRGVCETFLCDRFDVTCLDLRRAQMSLVFLFNLVHNVIDCEI